MYIEQTNSEFIIRIPKRNNAQQIKEAIDFLTYKAIIQKSKAKQKDVDSIMADIKKDRKKVMRPLIDKIKQKAK